MCLLEASFDAWLLEVFIALKTSFAWQNFCNAYVHFIALPFVMPPWLEALGMGYFFKSDILMFT